MANKEHLKWLMNQSNEELQSLLEKALPEMKSVDSLREKAESYRQNAQKVLQQSGQWRTRDWISIKLFLPLVIIFTFIMVGVVESIGIRTSFENTILISIGLAILLCILVCRLLIKFGESQAKGIEKQSHAESLKAVPFDNEARKKLENTIYLPAIPEGYCYTLALESMLEILKRGRANTWQELADRYEEQIHRWRMEENSRKKLEEQIRQSEIAEETLQQMRKAANWAVIGAIGSWTAAAGVWRINSKL